MLQQAIVTIVDFCTRYAAQIIGIAALFGLAAAVYAAGHFAIDADVNRFFPRTCPGRNAGGHSENPSPRRKKPSSPFFTPPPPDPPRRPPPPPSESRPTRSV